jgi:hypothetical protein
MATRNNDSQPTFLASVVSPAGHILAVSYPILAVSTGFRAVVQLCCRPEIIDKFPPAMSAVAALCYLAATIGFVYRRRWTWWLSLVVLGLETALTLLVGTWSFIEPEVVGRTVWRHFGEDYGYFPLIQPVLGLLWLLWPPTLALYGLTAKGMGEESR